MWISGSEGGAISLSLRLCRFTLDSSKGEHQRQRLHLHDRRWRLTRIIYFKSISVWQFNQTSKSVENMSLAKLLQPCQPRNLNFQIICFLRIGLYFIFVTLMKLCTDGLHKAIFSSFAFIFVTSTSVLIDM